ncbi:MAG: AMP-binding protein [Planctomycetaceae bacterium]|nr:AMP-binding protein [Planctomycetaceae bacterium]
MSASTNIASRLSLQAAQRPWQRAIVAPSGRDRSGRCCYAQLTFAQLDEETSRIAKGLQERGLKPGMKLVLFVPFSIEFITLTFALFKAGATIVLIDPGMGRTNIFKCLEEVRPDGFVAIPKVHLVRWWFGRRFPQAKFNVSVGRRLPGVLATLDELRQTPLQDFEPAVTQTNDSAAIIFTSGSTGPPKGVHYEHGMFDAQVDLIQQHYGIEPGEVDLPAFPLFGLFNAAMGVTTVIPDMDTTRPAQVNPERIIEAIRDQGVTQAFGSPAFWNRVGRYCEQHGITFPSVRRTLSAGGPVPIHVLRRMSAILTGPGADLYTPYGATESLPVASIGGREILETTAERTRQGAGTCVGNIFAGVDVRIIEITSEPIVSLADVQSQPVGEIGEIIVRSPSVTREYYLREEATRAAKIPDGETFWHRIGDVGYLDDEGRLWFCGRKAHIVETPAGRMFSVCCEAILEEHPRIYRTALVGVGTAPNQRPVIVAEPEEGEFSESSSGQQQLIRELLELAATHPLTQSIRDVLLHRSLPVDTRHNVKINREALAVWAAEQLGGR